MPEKGGRKNKDKEKSTEKGNITSQESYASFYTLPITHHHFRLQSLIKAAAGRFFPRQMLLHNVDRADGPSRTGIVFMMVTFATGVPEKVVIDTIPYLEASAGRHNSGTIYNNGVYEK